MVYRRDVSPEAAMLIRHALVLVLFLPPFVAGCGPSEPAFDEQAWYFEREVDPDPVGWVAGDWRYHHPSSIETIEFDADGRCRWERQMAGRPTLTSDGVWEGTRHHVTLAFTTNVGGPYVAPPERLLRVPTKTGDHLLTQQIYDRWRSRGFTPGDAPLAGRAFIRLLSTQAD
jgi:hypothetical protein